MAETFGAYTNTSRMPRVLFNQNGISHTGTLTETTKITATVPAGALGTSGHLFCRLIIEPTNNANAKTVTVKFGGTSLISQSVASVTEYRLEVDLFNTGAANAQHCFNGVGFGGNTNTLLTSAIDTASNADLTVTVTLGNTGDTVILNAFILLIPT